MSEDFIPAARPLIGQVERAAVDAVLASGMLAQGSEVAAFEREFSTALLDGRSAVAVNSGTSGLHLGLLAAGIGAGDDVIVPSFTFAATANAVALTGARPVFADIDPRTYCLDVASVGAAMTPNTRAIMPVHLYGHPADMTALTAFAADHGLDLFEDAAQAHGASWQGRAVGTFGSFAMFSLYPTKNMTSGEGGMVAASTTEMERALRLLRNQGMERQYANEMIGFNARMTDLHAAIGRVQLSRLQGWTERRRDNAAFLSKHLETVGTPAETAGARHVYHQYTVRVGDDRDGMARALRDEYGIGTGVYYPTPVHELAPFRPTGPSAGVSGSASGSVSGVPGAGGPDLPHTRAATEEVLSLPVHPSLRAEDLDRIVAAVNKLAAAGA